MDLVNVKTDKEHQCELGTTIDSLRSELSSNSVLIVRLERSIKRLGSLSPIENAVTKSPADSKLPTSHLEMLEDLRKGLASNNRDLLYCLENIERMI